MLWDLLQGSTGWTLSWPVTSGIHHYSTLQSVQQCSIHFYKRHMDILFLINFHFGHLLLFTQSCPTLCDPMNCSTPGFPILHHMPELAQIHVHWVGDAIQPPQSFSASGSFSVIQFFTSGSQNIRASALASVPPMNIQDWFTLGLTDLISLLFKGLSRVFSITTVQKHQLFDR